MKHINNQRIFTKPNIITKILFLTIFIVVLNISINKVLAEPCADDTQCPSGQVCNFVNGVAVGVGTCGADPSANNTENTTIPNLSNTGDGITNIANTIGYKTTGDAYSTIGNLIKVALSFLGIIFLILVILSGFQWMTAGGNEDTIKKSKARIKNAIMGLVIILIAYALTYFILDILLNQTIK